MDDRGYDDLRPSDLVDDSIAVNESFANPIIVELRHNPAGERELANALSDCNYSEDYSRRVRRRVPRDVFSDAVDIIERPRRPNYLVSHLENLASASFWDTTPSVSAASNP